LSSCARVMMQAWHIRLSVPVAAIRHGGGAPPLAVTGGRWRQLSQYAPVPDPTADQVFQRICRSSMNDQFST